MLHLKDAVLVVTIISPFNASSIVGASVIIINEGNFMSFSTDPLTCFYPRPSSLTSDLFLPVVVIKESSCMLNLTI